MEPTDDEHPWSAIAVEWAALWGAAADPARDALIAAVGIRSGSAVLDVGCGSGEFIRRLDAVGAEVSGIDPAAAMVALARSAAPGADIRLGSSDELPWAEDAFDAVTAVNSLQFADDPEAALSEFVRVLRPGGAVALANWAEAALSDLDAIEAAVAAAHDEDLGPDPDYRLPGGLEALLAAAGLHSIEAGVADVPWRASDAEELVRGVLLGEDAAGLNAGAATVITAARPFRRADGSYELMNRFRWAVGRKTAARD